MENDERFKHIATDPKFRRIPKADKKVKIDKRFRGMFEDEKFKIKYTVDKRGRPVNHTSNSDLKRYYHMSSDSEEPSESENEESGKYVRAPKSDSENDLKESKKGDKVIPDVVKKKLKDLSVDYARGEGCLNTDSSSDDESSEEESTEETDVEHDWGELDKDAETTDEATKRLAICNMDWDRIRAVDLMVTLSSFLPAGGHIESVTIYPSEFGKKRMHEEELKGPTELVNNKKYNDDDNDEETEEGSKYHMEKLRQYQLNRLRYYYAVAIFDSPETANKIYSECDGLEYESSATKLDLRFIPDDTTFTEKPKEKCDKLPELNKYQPRFFTTTALQQAKVELTWDETNPNRIEIAKKLSDGKIDDVTDADLQAYLASSSGEESEEEEDKEKTEIEENENSNEDPINKYRNLLAEIEKSSEEKNKKDVEMEVTWELNVKDKSEKLVKKKIEDGVDKTPFQQYLDKRKEKRKLKKKDKKNKDGQDEEQSDSDMDFDMNDPYFAEEFNNSEFKTKKKHDKKNKEEDNSEDEQQKAQLELLMLDNDDNKKHFNLKKLEIKETNKKKKRKSKNESAPSNENDDFQVDVKDARFSAIFSSHHYNIDPTDPRYKKTKGMEALIEEKQRRVETNDNDNVSDEQPPAKKPKAELNALVNSVKRKTKNLTRKK